jgi:hypothetical protein
MHARFALAPITLAITAALTLTGCTASTAGGVSGRDAPSATVTATPAVDPDVSEAEGSPVGEEVVDDGPLRTTGRTTTHVEGISPAAAPPATVAASSGKGYARSVAANWNQYTVHLISTSNIEHYRASLTRAARSLNSIAGTRITVAAGQVKAAPTTLDLGAIYVKQSSKSGCSGAWAGCAQTDSGYTSTCARIATGSLVTINGSYVNSYSDAWTDHVVFHELGHALGLDHYATSYQGRNQMMHPSSYASTTYQPGDRTGLTSLTSNSKHAPVGSLTVTGGANTVTVSGRAYDPDYDGQTGMKLLVDGATAATNINSGWIGSDGLRVYGAFNRTLDEVNAGTHAVQLQVQDKSSGAWTSLPTKSVTVTGFTASTPKVRGVAQTGQTLTAEAGSWKPANTQFLYRWQQDGKNISLASGQTLQLTKDMVGHLITVRVTGTATGYESLWRNSTAVRVSTAPLTVTHNSALTSKPQVGNRLIANSSGWAPGPVTLGYQWYQDGKVMRGQTASALPLNSSTRGHRYDVVVTGSKAGYTTRSIRSNRTAPVAAGTLTASAVSIGSAAGTPTFAQKLTAVPGTWTAGATLRYQWYIDRTPIKGATASTWTVNRADWIRHTIRVVVTGSKTGYATRSQTSPTYRLGAGVLTAPAATIAGEPKVGTSLTARPGTWTAGTALAYQWYRDGAPISGARSATLPVGQNLAGAKVTVGITGSKKDYTTATRTSSPVVVPTLAPSVTPAPTGTATPAATASAVTVQPSAAG